jgi:hypothetical protein
MKTRNETLETIKKMSSSYGHETLKADSIQTFIKEMTDTYSAIEGAYPASPIFQIEMTQNMIMLGEHQYTHLFAALKEAVQTVHEKEDRVIFAQIPNFYLQCNPSPNASSFEVPRQTPDIIISSSLVKLLKLNLKEKRPLAHVVLFHELGHLIFQQSHVNLGWRIWNALQNDGSYNKNSLCDSQKTVFQQYSVAMELSADKFMYTMMCELYNDRAWKYIAETFGMLVAGVEGLNVDSLLTQLPVTDFSAGDRTLEAIVCGTMNQYVTRLDAHPTIMFRLAQIKKMEDDRKSFCNTDLQANSARSLMVSKTCEKLRF